MEKTSSVKKLNTEFTENTEKKNEKRVGENAKVRMKVGAMECA